MNETPPVYAKREVRTDGKGRKTVVTRLVTSPTEQRAIEARKGR